MMSGNNLTQDNSIFLAINHLPIAFYNLVPCNNQLSPQIYKNQKKLKPISLGDEPGKGKWTKDEQKIYIDYIQSNKEQMDSKTRRKSQKVFLKMSYLVKTRTADQCRSHHQKILKYHGTIDDIIQHYSRQREEKGYSYKIGQAGFDEIMKKQTGEEGVTAVENEMYKIERISNYIRIQINQEYIRSYIQ